ncbi:MAG: LAGLIDADG family homing endonuclease [archaeon]
MSLDFKEEDVIVGRTGPQIKKYGKTATGYIGKIVVSGGEEPVLGKKVLMDLSRSHVAIVCGKRGGGKCVSGDTLITLDDGREIQIKDLEKNKSKIISLDNNYKLKQTPKDEFFKRKVKKLLHITLRSGKEIKLTPEHPLLTINGWMPAESLTTKSRIATPRIINNFGSKKIKDHEIKLISYILAEGHLGNNFVLFCNSDEKIVSDFKTAVKDFDSHLKINPHGKFNYRVVEYKTNKIITDIRDQRQKFAKGIKFDKKSSIRKYFEELNLYGKLAKDKFIPEIIFQLEKKQISLFLNRYFSCDGCIHFDKNKDHYRISCSSASKTMIYQVQSLLLKFGILSKIRIKKYKQFVNYELEVFVQDTLKFIKEIAFFGEKEKKQKIAETYKLNKIANPNIDTIPGEIWDIYRPNSWVTVGKEFNYKSPKSLRFSINYSPSREKLLKIGIADNNKQLQLIAQSDIFWDEIKEIKESKGSFEVYDLSVPNSHNFVANNIIIHNSYAMSVIVEEFARQPFEVKQRLSVIVIDTVGIFWTMKFANKESQDDLETWGLKPEGIDIRNLVPQDKLNFYKEKNLPVDGAFSIKTSQVDLEDWLAVFKLNWSDPETGLLNRSLETIKKKLGQLYDVDDIISTCKIDSETTTNIINSLTNRLNVAKSWGLFSKGGTSIRDFARSGTITTIDVSTYKQSIGMEATQELIVGLLGKKLYEERMLYRKEEEKNLLEGKRKESEMPIIWMMIDEAHMFMPQDRKSVALDVLLQWIRVGRQPGLSLLLATQRPNKLHSECISQCDFFLSMRMTAQEDIAAVSSIRPNYLNISMDKYYAQMPKAMGFAILVDDNSEKVMMLKIRPRLTWDGGKTANVFYD